MSDSLFPHGPWLLCPPRHFEVSYSINPWMDLRSTPSQTLALQQWIELHHTMIRLGVDVKYLKPVKGVPDLVFTANAALVRNGTAILARFRNKERSKEEAVNREWFERNGYSVKEISKGTFEGEGEAFFIGETLFCAIGPRSDRIGQEEVAKLTAAQEVEFCELIDPRFYHLDTCLCALDEKQAIFCREAFSDDSGTGMEKRITLHPVPLNEALRFACNAVVLGKDVILPAGCPETEALLRSLGFTPYPINVGEFLKAGGATKCLCLSLGG